MEDKDLILSIDHISKKYTRGQITGSTLKNELQRWWDEKKGQNDPDSMSGTKSSSFFALKDIDLQVRRGETIGIIGKNGAGKSTLLKLISRVTSPTAGTIDLYGRLTTMLEVGTGFDWELTGRENIYFNASLYGMSKKEIDRKMGDIIAFSGIEEFIDTPIKRYSSGMFMKLGFAIAVNLESDIMIVDEVLAVGDYNFQNKCIQALANASMQQGKAVLCVSHNMQHIRKLCSRCIVLHEGQKIFDGDTDKAIEIYLDQEIRDDVSIDYTHYDRPFWLTDRHFFAVSAAFEGHRTNTFANTEKPCVRIRVRADRIIRGVSLRIEIRDTLDVRIGTHILYNILDIVPGEACDILVEYPIDQLISGMYNVVYCFFVMDDLGNNQNIDHVPGLTFHVERKSRGTEVEWDRKEWGDIAFSGAKVLSVTRQEDSIDGSEA